ncbi:MAG: DUF721 domain-containing protein [Bacteroidaceae bacterium]|nr:DUF721 domain-containing protein [Bacteroidaceae bacterium]
MRRTDSETVQDVVYRFLRDQGLEMPLNEYRLIQAWNAVMDKSISLHTKELRIYNQVLFVTVTSAVVKNEIMMRRSVLVKTLNDHVGAQVIRDIMVR